MTASLSASGDLDALKIDGGGGGGAGHKNESETDRALRQLIGQLTLRSWDDIDRLVISDPSAAVQAAWEWLVYILNRRLILMGVRTTDPFRSLAGPTIARLLQLPSPEVAAIERLAQIRNGTVSGQQISQAGALEYVQASSA